MDNSLGQSLTDIRDKQKVEVTEGQMVKHRKISIGILYLYMLLYLLIPVLSIEGVVGWFLGLSGAYRTINIYRRGEENKKAVRLLIIYVAIAIFYNIIVFFLQRFIVSKTV